MRSESDQDYCRRHSGSREVAACHPLRRSFRTRNGVGRLDSSRREGSRLQGRSHQSEGDGARPALSARFGKRGSAALQPVHYASLWMALARLLLPRISLPVSDIGTGLARLLINSAGTLEILPGPFRSWGVPSGEDTSGLTVLIGPSFSAIQWPLGEAGRFSGRRRKQARGIESTTQLVEFTHWIVALASKHARLPERIRGGRRATHVSRAMRNASRYHLARQPHSM